MLRSTWSFFPNTLLIQAVDENIPTELPSSTDVLPQDEILAVMEFESGRQEGEESSPSKSPSSELLKAEGMAQIQDTVSPRKADDPVHEECIILEPTPHRARLIVEPQHTNIAEYTVPLTAVAPLRHEHVHTRSDFLVESIQDKERYNEYTSLTFMHASLRALASDKMPNNDEWSQLFPGLKHFVKLQYKEVEGSVFLWVALVPGVPNSPKILLHVLNMLTDIFVKKKGMKNIIITADAVEYQVLHRIRQEYGALMGHVYLYWGIWHALCNYLKQVFKAYKNAGIELMLSKLFSKSKVESLLKVTPNWSMTNRITLNLAEALVRMQWASFLEHVYNQMDGENIFNEEEQLRCHEILTVWNNQCMEYADKTKQSRKSNTEADTSMKGLQKMGKEKQAHGEKPSNTKDVALDKTKGFQLRSGKTLEVEPAMQTNVEGEEDKLFGSGEETSSSSQESGQTSSDHGLATASSPLAVSLPPSSICDPMDIAETLAVTESDHQNESNESITQAESSIELAQVLPRGAEAIEPDFVEESFVEDEVLEALEEKQKLLQELFNNQVLPLLKEFVEKARKQDKVFHLFSNMLEDLYPYVFGYLSVRLDDFEGQQLVTKLLFQNVHTTQQSMYKHILLQVLEEFPRWDDFPKRCFQYAPGANEIGGSRAATLGRDEAHERVMSLNLAYHHPVHPTEENVEIMCQSAPILCQNVLNMENNFFQKTK